MPELLLIAEPRDRVADELARAAAGRGIEAERLTYPEAALRMTVARRGTEVRVEPRAPIFLRPPAAASLWLPRVSQFHHQEVRTLVWAAAALTQAAVVNRPDSHGFASRAFGASAVLRNRAAVAENPVEVFSSGPPTVGDPQDWWLESQASGQVFALTGDVPDRGAFRSAHVRADRHTVTATVAGRRVFVADPEADGAHGLGARSLAVCRALGVSFAALTWRLPDGDAGLELARIDHRPGLQQIGGAWTAVADALLEELAA